MKEITPTGQPSVFEAFEREFITKKIIVKIIQAEEAIQKSVDFLYLNYQYLILPLH